MNSRRISREVALQILFQHQFRPEIDVSQSLGLYETCFLQAQDSWNYAKDLTMGVLEHLVAIDEVITKHLHNWKKERLAPVDLNVLRIAAFEMKFVTPAVPKKVVINEAVEIAKKFGSENSSAFINGVLDKLDS